MTIPNTLIADVAYAFRRCGVEDHLFVVKRLRSIRRDYSRVDFIIRNIMIMVDANMRS